MPYFPGCTSKKPPAQQARKDAKRRALVKLKEDYARTQRVMKPPMGIKADDQTLLEWICETEKYQSPKFNPAVVTAGFVQQAPLP